MPNGNLVNGLMGEIKQHPWTTLSAIAALGLVSLVIWAGLPRYKEAGEIAVRVQSLEFGQQQQLKETYQNRLQTIRAALFDLQSKIEEIKGRGSIPDKIYFDELKRLNAEESRAEQTLRAYVQTHPRLSEVP